MMAKGTCMTPRLRTGLLVGAAVVLGLTAWTAWGLYGEEADASVALRPGDAALVARGKSVYTAQCASCHGANLEGQANWRSRGPDGLLPAPPHDPSGHTWHHPDAMLFALTKFGPAAAVGDPNYRSLMPAYDGVLGDDDIVAVLSYIKSTWPLDVQAQHDTINKRFAGH